MSDRHFDPDAPEPTPEETDFEDAFAALDDEEPPASPSIADWNAALAESWGPWIWDEAAVQECVRQATYGPSRLLKGGTP